jgi:hypothetical protein
MRYDVSAALYRFYAFCAATTVPEIHDLAETIETWQAPTILRVGPHRRPCAAWVFVVAAPGRVLGVLS